MKKKIILIVGASGVGKDTLIREAKKELKKEFNFVRRYITRKPDKSEKNFFLENSAFKLLRDNKYFLSSWEAHGNSYAVSKKSIKKGANIISISRSKISDFERIFNNVYVINITLNKEELRTRLIKRGRESIEEIKKRLDRNYDEIKAKNLISFENDKSFEESRKSFIKLLKEIDEF
jgi:phosphonate metabolism protein PhnN/1,5-bisphosphokinase (PRPP-forming)